MRVHRNDEILDINIILDRTFINDRKCMKYLYDCTKSELGNINYCI